MKNCEIWDQSEIVPMFEKFCHLANYQPVGEAREKALVHWMIKEYNDAALAYDIGRLVQVRRGSRIFYAVIDGYEQPRETTHPNDLHYQVLMLRFADGSVERQCVSAKPKSSHGDADGMKDGECRYADIPEDVMRLMMPRCGVDWAGEELRKSCPFKDEFKTPMPPCITGGLANAQ